jgi:predicted O-linked N-acetylglucosamine transferase (SPINDLY family)
MPTLSIGDALKLADQHQRAGRLDEARRICGLILSQAPDDPAVLYHVGVLARGRGELQEALKLLGRAARLAPQIAQYQQELGKLLIQTYQFAEAVTAFGAAVRSSPQMPQAHVGLGNALFMAGRPDESVQAYQRAIELGGADATTHNNFAHALRAQGRLDECIAEYERAVQLQPDYAAADSNRIYALLFDPKCSQEKLREQMAQWNNRHGRPPAGSLMPHVNEPDPDRRLRIGYLSPYFFAHAESFFVVPLLKQHDHRQFEIFCYSNSFHSDAVTNALQASADGWRNIGAITDAAAAAQIRKDRIDVLVDLAMHMAQNRLPMLAHKPAPVQATWLAYPGGTGLEAIDYRITDPFIDPPTAPGGPIVEEPFPLPDCWCCYDPLCDLPLSEPRMDGPICFGSLNNPCKLNPSLLQLWGKVLRAVPDSRLAIQVISDHQRRQVLRVLEDAGVAPRRIELLDFFSRPDYLRAYDRIDICLDTLPYNGITTTCDALWMGVPVVTLIGKTPAGRAGLSILASVGLGELAAHDPDQFVAIATKLAGQRPRLAEWRRTLRQTIQQSPLMDAPRFCRNMERAYREMWRNWCVGKKSPGP